MTIASVGTGGTAAHSTSASSFTLTTATNTINASDNRFAMMAVVADNRTGTDGDNTEHTTITGGNGEWRKLGEYTNSPTGAAADGVTTSLWLFVPTGNNATSTVFTINLSGTAVDKTATLWVFSRATGKFVRFDPEAGGCAAVEVTGANGFGSSSFSALTSKQRLYFRAMGKEANSTTDITPTTNFTAVTLERSRNNAAAVLVRGEFRVNTSTGETSNPTLAVSGDTSSVFACLEEVDGIEATPFPTYTVSSNLGSLFHGQDNPGGGLRNGNVAGVASIWESDSTGFQYIKADFGASPPRVDSWDIYAATTDDGTYPLEYSTDNSTWTRLGTYANSTSLIDRIATGGITARYWRISATGQNVLAAQFAPIQSASQTYAVAVNVTSSASPTFNKAAGPRFSLSASSSLAVVAARAIPITVTATTSLARVLTVGLVRNVATAASLGLIRTVGLVKAFTAAGSPSAASALSYQRTSAFTATGSLSKATLYAHGIAVSVAAAGSMALVRTVALVRDFTAAPAFVVVRAIGLVRSVGATGSAALDYGRNYVKTVTTTATGSLVTMRQLVRAVTVPVTANATLGLTRLVALTKAFAAVSAMTMQRGTALKLEFIAAPVAVVHAARTLVASWLFESFGDAFVKPLVAVATGTMRRLHIAREDRTSRIPGENS